MGSPLPTSVNIPAMATAQGIFQNALDAVDTSYKDLNSQQATLAENWSGDTASQFGIAVDDFLANLTKVKNALVAVMDAMSKNTGIYVNTQEDSAQVQSAFQGTIADSAFQGLPGLAI